MTYNNLHHIMETVKTMDKVKVQAPKQFTKQGVIEYLESRGGKAIMDTRAVAAILERDMQTIRRYAKRGELKCDMSVFNRAVYSIEDVADFLLAHPSICGMSKNEFQLTEKTTELIRRIACKNWKPLVDRLGLDDVVVEDEAEWELSETQDNLFEGWKVEMRSFHSDRVLRKIEEVNLKAQQQAMQKRTKSKEVPYNPIKISDEGLETIEWLSLDCTTAVKQAPWHSDAEVKIDRLGYVILNGKKTQDFWDGTIKCDHKPLRMKVRNICGDETVFQL